MYKLTKNLMYNIGIIGNGFVGNALQMDSQKFGFEANIRIFDINIKKSIHPRNCK